jgi:DeoR/GlpR family transcriptional regulator of sugar metabolism
MHYGAQEIRETTVVSIDDIGGRMGLKTMTIRKFIQRFKRTGKLFE